MTSLENISRSMRALITDHDAQLAAVAEIIRAAEKVCRDPDATKAEVRVAAATVSALKPHLSSIERRLRDIWHQLKAAEDSYTVKTMPESVRGMPVIAELMGDPTLPRGYEIAVLPCIPPRRFIVHSPIGQFGEHYIVVEKGAVGDYVRCVGGRY